MSKNISELSGRKDLKNNLFDRYGRLREEGRIQDVDALEKLADEFLIGTASTYGAISFYDFLRSENQGKKIYVCNGTVCMCAGTQDKLHQNLKLFFADDEIGEMCCLGRCYENGAFQYNGRNFSGLKESDYKAVFNHQTVKHGQYQVKAKEQSILIKGTVTLNEFKTMASELFSHDPEEILKEIEASRLRGRGGAGFPMATKLKTCQSTKSETKFVICNADEGDPGAYSDRFLLEERIFDVLFGMLMAAYVVRASHGILYIRGEYPESVNKVFDAIQSLRNLNLLGKNILETNFSFDLKIIKAQGAYICGEETALINSIEGQRPEVRIRPPFPAQQGLFNKPTIVNNVETLAVLPYIFDHGGDHYSKLGTDRSAGTKLLSLDSGFVYPGIYEVEMGTPLEEVIFDLAGGYRRSIKALHIGGPLGGVVPVSHVEKLRVDFESFSRAGFLLGHASIVTIPTDFPMIKYLEHLFQFAAFESCGKCFPCRLGTKRAEELFGKAYHDGYKIDRDLIDDILHALEEGSLCAHGGGIPLPARNIIKYFESELMPYFK